MAQLAALLAGLLLIAASQASDVVDRSTPQGFLSKYMSSGAAFAPRASPKRGITAPSLGASPYTIVNDKPVLQQTAQVQDSTPFTSARAESSISTKDFNPPKTADKEVVQVVQKPPANHSHKPITLSAFGVGLLSLVTMLVVRMRRHLQPATALASSGSPINTASVSGDNIMEMKSQDSCVCKVDSNRGGWGQLSAQNSHPLTVCYAEGPGQEDYVNPVTEFLGRFIPKQAPVVLDVDWTKAKQPLPLAELAGALDRGLREREWFVTGNMLPELFADDFKFEDPDVSLTGIQNYAEGVARLFGDDARCEVISCVPRGADEIVVDWRLSGSVRVGPGATIKPYIVHTTFRVTDGAPGMFGSRRFLVAYQEDEFSIPGWQILLGVLLPGLPLPEAAAPVEELRRQAAGDGT